MTDKVTAPKIRGMKGQRPIVCITAYDAPTGAIADEAGADLVLVGDSVGNTVLGYDSTLPVSLEDMVHHTEAVARACKRALLVADMPFGSYQSSVSESVASGVALMKAGAEAVKLEGDYPEAIAALTRAGIPTMGHVGMTPQSFHIFGGFKVQGKGSSAERIIEIARRLDEAGAFAIVLELIPQDLARRISKEVAAATIGIGAGPLCDGQIQVLHDVIGLSEETFKHAKAYASVRSEMLRALEQYAEEVRSGKFPDSDHSF